MYNTANSIVGIEGFLLKNLDTILDKNGTLTTEELEQFETELVKATGSYSFAQELLIPFYKDKPVNKDVLPETKTIISQAAAKLFVKKEYSIDNWLKVLDWFDIHIEFFTALKEVASEICYVHAIEKIVKDIFTDPALLVTKSEREHFITYLETWKHENDVRELWYAGENSYFPFEYDAFSFPSLLNNIARLATLCNQLKAPCLLYEFYAHLFHYSNDPDSKILLKLLQAAPSSVTDTNNMEWNQSFLAPTLLHYLVSKRLHVSSNTELSDEDITVARRYFEKIGVILHNRNDGYFLTKKYLRYLEPKKHTNIQLANLCMARLGDALAQEESDYIKKNPLASLFTEDSELIKEKFCRTGILLSQQKDSICLSFISQLQFFTKEEQIKELFPFFEASLLYEDKSLPCYEASPLLCHYDAATFYMMGNNEQVSQRWENTWNLFATARRRIDYSYYDKMALALRHNINFLLLIGSSLLHVLFVNKNYTEMEKLWNKLWEIAKSSLQHSISASEDFYLHYASILGVWKAKLLEVKSQETAIKITIVHVVTLASYPKLLILTVQLLQNNHCFNKTPLTKEQSLLLMDSLNKALTYCKGIESEIRLYEMGMKCLTELKRIPLSQESVKDES